MKNVLVTGGCGFIGSNLSLALKQEGYNVTIIDDLSSARKDWKTTLSNTDIEVIANCFASDEIVHRIESKQFDIIFHNAAIPRVSYSVENPYITTDVNISKTVRLLEAAVDNVERFIFASSSEVYGEPKKNPITEKSDLNGKSIYAITKIVNEESIKKNKLKNYTILRFFNTIGEGQVGQFVVSKFIKRVKEKKNIIINGNGTQIRGYAHAEDIAKAIKKIIFLKKTYLKTYN